MSAVLKASRVRLLPAHRESEASKGMLEKLEIKVPSENAVFKDLLERLDLSETKARKAIKASSGFKAVKESKEKLALKVWLALKAPDLPGRRVPKASKDSLAQLAVKVKSGHRAHTEFKVRREIKVLAEFRALMVTL